MKELEVINAFIELKVRKAHIKMRVEELKENPDPNQLLKFLASIKTQRPRMQYLENVIKANGRRSLVLVKDEP